MPSDKPVDEQVVLPYAGLRPRQPLWVRVGLWGLSGRGSAWVRFANRSFGGAFWCTGVQSGARRRRWVRFAI